MTSYNPKKIYELNAWSLTWCLVLAVAVFILPDLALAAANNVAYDATLANQNQITRVVCRIVLVMQGNIARGVAAIGVIFLGFSLFLGKISWGTALALGLGLGAIFGAQQLVNLVGSGSMDCLSMANATN